MSVPSAEILVFAGEKFVCIKIIGRANFTSSIDFKTLVNELRQKGYQYFVLDLSECLLMDSTFLGVLTGFGLKMGPDDQQTGARSIELFNPNPRITELLENLGVLHLFRVKHGRVAVPECTEQTLTPINASREEVTRACLEAHETLMNISPENVSRFKEVTQFLAEDLKKLKARE